MNNLNPIKNHIGLDISDYKIRYIQFHEKRGGKIKINSYGEVPTPKDLISAGSIKDEDKVSNLIKELINKPKYGKVDSKYVNASLPEKRTFLKTVNIPKVPDNELKGAVSWAIEQNIPISLDQVYFDWQIIDSAPNEKNQLKALTIVAPRDMTNQYSRIIHNAGLIPVGLENESLAITRCLVDQKQTNKNSLLIIDMGRSRTNLIIFHQGTVYFTSSIEVSGHEMTEVITKALNLSYEDAEKAKIIYGLDKTKARGVINKVLEPIMKRFVIKINENIGYFNNYLISDYKINTILLTGSVSQTLGLLTYLQKNLQLNVLLGDPWINLTFFDSKKIAPRSTFFSFTTAIGLALKKSDL